MKAKKIFEATLTLVFIIVFSTLTSCGEWGGLPEGYSFDKTSNNSGGISSGIKPTERGSIIEEGIVDLGLSVKWNASNLGATYCYEYGNTFNFGYTSNDCPEEIGGTEYDHSALELGFGWTTPSKAQFEELFDKCYIEYGFYRGVEGIFATGSTMNTLFLPDASYWTSSLNLSSNKGWYVYFWDSIWSDYHNFYDKERTIGYRIRPVHK